MKPAEVRARLGDLPYMNLKQGRALYKFIKLHDLRCCLELGFYHGVSSAYISGALQDLGGGLLVTIDLTTAEKLTPNIEKVLALLQLKRYVEYHYEPRSYNWRLMKFMEAGMYERFDFCFIDGGHSWDTTGFAFCLVSRLLKPGGWILFDDLDWTLERSRMANQDWAKKLSVEERATPQIRRVYELLVKTDPEFDTFFTDGRWAFARKKQTIHP